jgi:hypothetical protein
MSRRTRRAALRTLGLLATLACAAPAAADASAREARPAAGVERVVLRAVGDLIVTRGTREALVIEAEKRLLPRIVSEVKHGTLTFDIRGGDFVSRRPVRYHLTVKNLKAIETHGSGDIHAIDLRGPAFRLLLAGSGDAVLRRLEAGRLTVQIDSSAKVVLDGRADAQTVMIPGAGDYDARRLLSTRARVDIGGAGNVRLHVSQHLVARIGGSGEIEYSGSPVVDSAITGAGEVLHVGRAP